MKKTVLLVIMICIASHFLHAQINRPEIIKKRTGEQTKTAPAPTTTQQVTPVYSMTAARVSIRTGSDNKEFPSTIYVEIWQKGHPGGALYSPHCLFKVHNLKNEMATNGTTDLGLEKVDGATDKFLLSTIQKYGLELDVAYNPKCFTDTNLTPLMASIVK